MNIAIIPARGGSKRIPKKNIRQFRGKPIISWTINTAIKSNCFDKIIVSTDSIEIAKIAEDLGAWIPFIRSKDISDDYTTTQDVIVNCINWLEKNNFCYDYICSLYATAPFLQKSDLVRAINLIKNEKKDRFIFTATKFSYPIQRAIKINNFGISCMFNPENYTTRSQDLEDAYHDAGQFYIAKSKVWRVNQNLFQEGMPLIIPNWRVQDIDNEDDWKRAEMLHEILEKNYS